jgi:hypothetical protein
MKEKKKVEFDLDYPKVNDLLSLDNVITTTEDYLLAKEMREEIKTKELEKEFVGVDFDRKKRSTFSHFPTDLTPEQQHKSLRVFQLGDEKRISRSLMEIMIFPIVVLIMLYRKIKLFF